MLIYKLKWEDRNGKNTEWFGTKKELFSRKTVLMHQMVKRPYDQIEITFAWSVEVPTKKDLLLVWLRKQKWSYASG